MQRWIGPNEGKRTESRVLVIEHRNAFSTLCRPVKEGVGAVGKARRPWRHRPDKNASDIFRSVNLSEAGSDYVSGLRNIRFQNLVFLGSAQDSQGRERDGADRQWRPNPWHQVEAWVWDNNWWGTFAIGYLWQGAVPAVTRQPSHNRTERRPRPGRRGGPVHTYAAPGPAQAWWIIESRMKVIEGRG